KLRARIQNLQEQYEIIGDVRGLGPMMGIELVKDQKSKEPAADETGEVVKRCYETGLIVLRCGVYHNVIRILMPLVITDDQLKRGFSILDDSLREVA
ncbi:MAG: aminotransferase class III-fold pyridoxal phosphate-dependent enzyme, partial [Proteobacteria bacterium]|nr:aminotransferase class III-fold pyridoxal phosphate-dependent enzyme [Pseudomonadota bacterium]